MKKHQMTRDEALIKAHDMFESRDLLTELKWQKEYFRIGYIGLQDTLFYLWIFDKALQTITEQNEEIARLKEIIKQTHETQEAADDR